MNHKLKRLGASVGAVLVLSLVITSVAVAAPQFTSSTYPTTYKASGGSTYGYVTTEAGRTECETVSASATLSAASSTLTIVEAAASGCTAFGSFSATITPNGCSSLVHVKEQLSVDTYTATVDLLCPEGKAITTVAGTCETKVFPQTGIATVKLTDDTEKGSVKVDLTNSSFKYTVTKDSFLCPFNGTGEKTGATVVQLKTAVISVEGRNVNVSGS